MVKYGAGESVLSQTLEIKTLKIDSKDGQNFELNTIVGNSNSIFNITRYGQENTYRPKEVVVDIAPGETLYIKDIPISDDIKKQKKITVIEFTKNNPATPKIKNRI